MRYHLLAVIAVAALAAAPAVAQQTQPPPAEAAPTAGTPADPPYSPRGAFIRSLVLPGWGQAYVGSPGRGAAYFTIASAGYVMTYVSRRKLLDARAEQAWLRETGQLDAEEDSRFVLDRERQFEDLAAMTLFLLFLSGADAYVSAYLADFDERIGVVPEPDGALRFQLRLPLGPGR